MFVESLSFDDVLIVPQHSTVKSRREVDISTNLLGIDLQIPILSANMSTVTNGDMADHMANLGGLGVIHRMQTIEEEANEVAKVVDGPVAFSFGIRDWQKRVKACFYEFGEIAVLDVAHADQEQVFEIVENWYSEFKDAKLIVGNVATRASVMRILNVFKGSESNIAFKVGIGGGSMCTTRIQTGCGIPTFQSVYDIRETFSDLHLIADGGIRSSGDIVKAIGAGANAVMLGRLLAGTYESAGSSIDGTHKTYRGSASEADKALRGEGYRNIEGEQSVIPIVGNLFSVIEELSDGIRSGISYAGYNSVQEMIGNAQFTKITQNGLHESYAHGLTNK